MASPLSFQLPENITIAHAQGLHEQLEKLLEQPDHDNIVFDAHAVARTDTAGVQLLLAFVKTANEHKLNLSWQDPSDSLLSAASTLGLKEALGIH